MGRQLETSSLQGPVNVSLFNISKHPILTTRVSFSQLIMSTYALQFLHLTTAWSSHSSSTCKAVPGSDAWPRDHEWMALNLSLSGRLLKPSPPGAVCHPSKPTFNLAACSSVQSGWFTTKWHSNDPVSVPENTWVNDTCLPFPMNPCSGQG